MKIPTGLYLRLRPAGQLLTDDENGLLLERNPKQAVSGSEDIQRSSDRSERRQRA